MGKTIGWILVAFWVLYDIVLWRWPIIVIRIAQEPISGSGYAVGNMLFLAIGYAVGNMLFLAIGVWLVCRKGKKCDKEKA